jgi:molecular chaperone HscA
VTKSRLDDASIRSEIHVDEQLRYVRYGERAFVARKDTKVPALYEASPKLWLKEPARLGDEAAPGLALTREQLLSGLLAYAIRAAADADEIGASTLKGIDIRIAHPVWPAQVKAAANAALARICAQARQMAFEREWGTVTVASLREHVQVPATPRAAACDVIEPVAAAAELLPSEENLVRMCAVVDVGAGTTDIGLFLSLVPDGVSTVKSKLYRTGDPVSVFKAGNVIDEIVLKLLEARAKEPTTVALADVRARIRGIKETLFRDGFIQELGCDVHLKDLKAHPEAKAMAHEIRSQLLGLVRDNAKTIATWLDKPVHSISRLDVVMAGGGSSIEFVLSAIDQPIPIDHRMLQVKLTIPGERAGINSYGASRGRMAVALGGASHDYEALVHEQPTVTKIRRGSL